MAMAQTQLATDRHESGDVSQGTVLEVEGLQVCYRNRASSMNAVDGVDLCVMPREQIAVVGESGSGKTSMALAIGGLLDGKQATVEVKRYTIDGRPCRPTGEQVLPSGVPGVSMIFQDAMTSLDPVWSIGSQLLSVIRRRDRMTRGNARTEAVEWLRRVQLSDPERVLRSRPYELSGGMRQRVMIAVALCSHPKLLVADEPTSALDASLARSVMDLIADLTQVLGTAVLLVTHDISLARHYADRVLVMYGGRIVEEFSGGLHGDVKEARHPYTLGLLGCTPSLDSVNLAELPTIAAAKGWTKHNVEGGCSFRSRCPAATQACGIAPPEHELEPGHRIRCWNPAAQEGGASETEGCGSWSTNNHND